MNDNQMAQRNGVDDDDEDEYIVVVLCSSHQYIDMCGDAIKE